MPPFEVHVTHEPVVIAIRTYWPVLCQNEKKFRKSLKTQRFDSWFEHFTAESEAAEDRTSGDRPRPMDAVHSAGCKSVASPLHTSRQSRDTRRCWSRSLARPFRRSRAPFAGNAARFTSLNSSRGTRKPRQPHHPRQRRTPRPGPPFATSSSMEQTQIR